MNENISCMIVDDEPLAIALLKEQLSHIFRDIRIIATCTHWEDALDTLRHTSPDILFMDISMPGKTGMELLRLLPALDSELIFTTAHDEYALEAFRFTASGYLLKPVLDSDLSITVNRAIEHVQNKRMARMAGGTTTPLSNRIGIPNRHGIDYVNIQDILYLESVNKCTRIVTVQKEHTSLSALIKFRMLTDHYHFIQVHRSFIINLDRISRYETSGLVTMCNKQDIPVARTFRNDLLRQFHIDL